MFKNIRNILSKIFFVSIVFGSTYFVTSILSRKGHHKFYFEHNGTEMNMYDIRMNSSDDDRYESQSAPDYAHIYHLNISFHSGLIVASSDFRRRFDLFKNGSSVKPMSSLSSIFKTYCPEVPPHTGDRLEVDLSFEPMALIERKLAGVITKGGFYRPKACRSRDRVALIVPFRDRYKHLPIFLKNMHPFLIRQQVEYKIFLVEQTNGKLFNRAALMNIGYLEAAKMSHWDCYIFHDVDLLPLDNRNLYTCPDQPRHMSVAIDIFGFKLPYNSIFGGVSAMSQEQFSKVNGFSNSFWGWGGEDDDMSNRLQHANYHISRYPINIARYLMLNHLKEKANPNRYEHLANGLHKYESDGLNSIKYKIYKFKRFPLFTWFLAELKSTEEMKHT